MDAFDDSAISLEETTLSYENDVPYEAQIPMDPPRSSLANRIGKGKVYLLSETARARVGKRKHDEDADRLDDDVEMLEDADLSHRPNALLLQGTPISHLPTDRLFAYATHFDAHPMGLEWIDDNTCVFVFETNAAARTAQRQLQKSVAEDIDPDGFVTAKPIPIALWPPEHRINKSLGKGEGLKGTVHMRWARVDDVKKRGAKKMSEFYKKHGSNAGKDALAEGADRPEKRPRNDDALEKAKLDEDLDNFLASEEESDPPPPPSKMRADYIASDGRTLLERTSLIRAHPTTLADRITSPLPRRAARVRDTEARWTHDAASIELGRRGSRPAKSQKELDDELEEFLRER